MNTKTNNIEDSPYKRLINDSIVFTIGNLGSKLIVFFMLPLYTYVFSRSQFGITDLGQTTINLLLPIAFLSISDAALRFGLDNSEDINKIFTNTTLITVIISIILIPISIIGHFLHIEYAIYIGCILIFQGINILFAQFSKSIGETRIYAANGILSTLILAIFNVLLLVIFKMGVVGFFLSMIISSIFSSTYVFFRCGLIHYFCLKKVDISKAKELLKFSIPLIPNSIAWWSTNDINRYFILFFLGTAANGIFAVSYKIPSIISLMTSIFFQSWQISAVKEFQKSLKDNFYTNVFSMYSKFLFICVTILIAFIKVIVRILASPAFYPSWEYAPMMLLTVLYASFSGFLGQSYIVAKKTKNIFFTTMVGSAINVILNLLLIPYIGLFGVGISSSISFLVIWLYRQKDSQRFISICLDWRNILMNHFVIICEVIILLQGKNTFWEISGLITLIGISLVINRSCVQNVLKLFKIL